MTWYIVAFLAGVLCAWVFKEWRAGKLAADLDAAKAELAAVKAKL